MGGGSRGGSYVPSSDELAFKTLKDWFDAVTSFMGTADELYEILDDFEAWAKAQVRTVKIIARRFIHKVRGDVEEREREREKKEPKEGGKDSGSAGAGEPEGSTAPAGAVKEPRPKGRGKVVWKSPEFFPYQTTPSPGYEGEDYVLNKKHRVYGIEEKIAKSTLGKGYKYKGSGGGWEKHLHSDLKAGLERFRAALSDVYGYEDDLPFDSCYRPLGTHVPPGGEQQPGDKGGYTDSTDRKGHWTGESVDLHTKEVRGHFGIPYKDRNVNNFLDKIGKVVGLKRPWLNIKDGVHWTFFEPTSDTFPEITIGDVTYGGQKRNP